MLRVYSVPTPEHNADHVLTNVSPKTLLDRLSLPL